MSLLNQGLNVQALQAKANKQALTNKDIAKITGANLRLVHKPDAPKTNVINLEERRVLASHTSPEAA
jgi:hypothetical protein